MFEVTKAVMFAGAAATTEVVGGSIGLAGDAVEKVGEGLHWTEEKIEIATNTLDRKSAECIIASIVKQYSGI